jgi:hypothetical protein
MQQLWARIRGTCVLGNKRCRLPGMQLFGCGALALLLRPQEQCFLWFQQHIFVVQYVHGEFVRDLQRLVARGIESCSYVPELRHPRYVISPLILALWRAAYGLLCRRSGGRLPLAWATRGGSMGNRAAAGRHYTQGTLSSACLRKRAGNPAAWCLRGIACTDLDSRGSRARLGSASEHSFPGI